VCEHGEFEIRDSRCDACRRADGERGASRVWRPFSRNAAGNLPSSASRETLLADPRDRDRSIPFVLASLPSLGSRSLVPISTTFGETEVKAKVSETDERAARSSPHIRPASRSKLSPPSLARSCRFRAFGPPNRARARARCQCRVATTENSSNSQTRSGKLGIRLSYEREEHESNQRARWPAHDIALLCLSGLVREIEKTAASCPSSPSRYKLVPKRATAPGAVFAEARQKEHAASGKLISV